MSNEERQSLDPALANILGNIEGKFKPTASASAESPAPEPERPLTKVEKERERRQRRAKQQVRYDLPPGMKGRLTEIAEAWQVPPGHLAAFLLADALQRLEDGEIDPEPFLVASRSLKYELDIWLEDWPW